MEHNIRVSVSASKKASLFFGLSTKWFFVFVFFIPVNLMFGEYSIVKWGDFLAILLFIVDLYLSIYLKKTASEFWKILKKAFLKQYKYPVNF